jgi:hypothetical protein
MAINYKAEYNVLLNNIHMGTAAPGMGSGWRSEDLKFSGRVNVYYENFLNDQELASLTLLYSSKEAAVQFRGPAYLEYMRLQEKLSK